MPFTLAHPAAVLPLRRLCPRRLNFCALVVGSLSPDAGYGFGGWNWDELSHRFIGGFTFCLPVSLVMLLFIYGLRRPLLNSLPRQFQRLLLPQCWRPIGPPMILIASIFIGIWTHQGWDSLTHNHGWLVNQVPLLQTRLVTVHYRSLEVCHLLWYGSSSVGVVCVCFAYERRLRVETCVAPARPWCNALLMGVLVLPIEIIHHLIGGIIGFTLVGACTLLLIIGITLKIGRELPDASPKAA